MMQAVVLAGGLATRMRPRTLAVAKSMLEVAGRPFVDWQLERLAACGYTDVVICVAHLGEQIEAHVGSGEAFGLRVRYSYEGPTLLGTAGALRAALSLLEPTFLVTYGDSYLPFDYAEPLRVLDADDGEDWEWEGVMSVYENDGRWDSSNVLMDATGERLLRYEKGTKDPAFHHIDYGAIALRRSVIARLPEGRPLALDAVQRELAEWGLLGAVVARERFYEIGSPEGLEALDRKLSAR
jgi:N-acetyl-alpha-D-muramate 1-phosphate uridylyltransferase